MSTKKQNLLLNNLIQGVASLMVTAKLSCCRHVFLVTVYVSVKFKIEWRPLVTDPKVYQPYIRAKRNIIVPLSLERFITNLSPKRDSNSSLFHWTEYQADALPSELSRLDSIIIIYYFLEYYQFLANAIFGNFISIKPSNKTLMFLTIIQLKIIFFRSNIVLFLSSRGGLEVELPSSFNTWTYSLLRWIEYRLGHGTGR